MTFLNGYADGAAASEGEIPSNWETRLLTLMRPLSSCDYSTKGALEGNRERRMWCHPSFSSTHHGYAFSTAWQDRWSTAVQEMSCIQTATSQGNFSEDQFSQMQNGNKNYSRKNTRKCWNDRCSKGAMQLSLLIRLLQIMKTLSFCLNLYFLNYILIFCSAFTATKWKI